MLSPLFIGGLSFAWCVCLVVYDLLLYAPQVVGAEAENYSEDLSDCGYFSDLVLLFLILI